MKDRLNPVHSSYIFKNVLSGKGLPIWANKTLNILDCLPEETLDKILDKDPKSIYELYNFKTIKEKATFDNNKKLRTLLEEITGSDTDNQSTWLNSLSSLSELLNPNKENLTAEAYIYSKIEEYTSDYTKVPFFKTTFTFEIKNRVRDNFLLKNDFEDIQFFFDRRTYGKVLATGVVENRKGYLRDLSIEEAKDILKKISEKVAFYDNELNTINENDKSYYYQIIHLIKYYSYMETVLSYKVED